MRLFPPAWFLGVYEYLLGAKDIFFLILCKRAVTGIAAALLFSLAAYCLCYRHHARRVLEQSLTKLSGRKLSGKNLFGQKLAERSASPLLRRFVKTAPEQGTVVFAIQTLLRSRHHKLITGFSLATALVWALQTAGPAAVLHFHSARAWRPWELESVLAVPLVIAAALISALSYVFQLPSDLPAAWVFRIAERTSRAELLDGVESLLVLCGLVPVLLLTAPFEALTLNGSVALAHMALVGVLALLLVEVRLYDWTNSFRMLLRSGTTQFLADARHLSAPFRDLDPNDHVFRSSTLAPVQPACGRYRAQCRLFLSPLRTPLPVEPSPVAVR